MTEQKTITYDLSFPHHEAPPSQEEFEELMNAMSLFDLSFSEIMQYLDEGRWEDIAFGNAPKLVNESELLPCPCCGSDLIRFNQFHSRRKHTGIGDMVICESCGLQTKLLWRKKGGVNMEENQALAAMLWNRRSGE